MANSAVKNPSRRSFLCTAPAVAVAGLTLADLSLLTPQAEAQAAAPDAFQLFTADALNGDMKALGAAPGNNNLVTLKNFTVVMTVEKTKQGKEFEWHEERDHVFQILEGSTVYEVGGKPIGAHSKAPGEWNAPSAEGASTLTLKKGDMLTIPRGTPHRRTTAESVTLLLISPQGTVRA
jgi:quercetin dioxygenase-like cupin family protein